MPAAVIGYARVSTEDQNLDLQRDALNRAGCTRIYEDRLSGVKAARPGLALALEVARRGDQLVVWRLDRLGRSMSDLIALTRTLQERGVELRSLTEGIDTGTINGKFTFHLFAALAEFERALIRERTQAGLAAARARGRKGGRPKLLDPEKRRHVVALYNDKQHSVAEICRLMGISKPTLYSYLRGQWLGRVAHSQRGADQPAPSAGDAAGAACRSQRHDRRSGGALRRVARNPLSRLRQQLHPRPLHRADRGKPKVIPAAELVRYCETIAAMKLRTLNGKGRHLSTAQAIRILEEHGVETPDGPVRVPPGLLTKQTANRYLKEWGYDHDRMTRPPAAVRFQAEHSNALWHFDLSPSDLKQVECPSWIEPGRALPP